jgi:hypothetical protein
MTTRSSLPQVSRPDVTFTPSSERTTMTNRKDNPQRSAAKKTARLILAGAAALGLTSVTMAGCGPTFDPASLIKTTRVLGARVVAGDASDPTRAAPQPGESATVTWLVESPAETPPLGWAFALCAPAAASTRLDCGSAPFALFQGTEDPPRMTITAPDAAELGASQNLLLYGRVCVDSQPAFDPTSGLPACSDGKPGTTATATILVGGPTVANHNPTAERGFTFDGAPWPATASGDDPCAAGAAAPRVQAGTEKHTIGIATAGSDRETYTILYGDPPVETTKRESLQISQFATAGKFKSAYTFVESDDGAADPVGEARWDAPKAADISAATPVRFTFVVHDGRGGTDWTTRSACAVP